MRLLATVVAVFAFLAGTAQAATIYVKNVDADLSVREIQTALKTFSVASREDFAPEWGVSANLVYLDNKSDAPTGAWVMYLTSAPPCFFCAGFHDVSADGDPYAVVGVFDPEIASWTVVFTHELWEMLVDPYVNRGVVVSPKPGVHRWYALETADPVEGDQFAYERDGLKISDFVTEAWFRRGSKGPWDFARHCKRPLQILEDGYQLVWRNGTYVATRGHLKQQ